MLTTCYHAHSVQHAPAAVTLSAHSLTGCLLRQLPLLRDRNSCCPRLLCRCAYRTRCNRHQFRLHRCCSCWYSSSGTAAGTALPALREESRIRQRTACDHAYQTNFCATRTEALLHLYMTITSALATGYILVKRQYLAPAPLMLVLRLRRRLLGPKGCYVLSPVQPCCQPVGVAAHLQGRLARQTVHAAAPLPVCMQMTARCRSCQLYRLQLCRTMPHVQLHLHLAAAAVGQLLAECLPRHSHLHPCFCRLRPPPLLLPQC